MLEQTRQDAPSPWHEGELAMQRSVGVVERMDGPGRNFVRKAMPEQHRAFFPMLPFLVLGAVDAKGDVWATVRAGRPGFLASPEPELLDVDLPRDAADPADAGMGDGDAVAMLGIQLETRRRNRLNGVIRRTQAGAFHVRVGQSFGNCPQYIQPRSCAFVRDPDLPTAMQPLRSGQLDDRMRRMVEGADTFFVASYVDRDGGERQVDVSHRGGYAGFVRLGADGVLTIPDFSGNRFFNTLGNFLVNPKAGLVFVDFESGDMLQMTGRAEVLLDSPDVGTFEGAERLWRFTAEQIVFRPDALPLRWSKETPDLPRRSRG
ncbi:flavin-nucleotide-binding protein [Rhizobium chutanense]|uniref:Flavin-nucleotide-binding protein n=1 Tax=Rhizobium chutanense TaxID=2035448 RepID=A0A2A6JHF2_9HYPH|nr:pyridoxamine 5'-phosphate oxidase family protein [Rhizobium chutanense]PDT05328.1 flavin-nucleotide-binding protein [Rhizobium chutanense]